MSICFFCRKQKFLLWKSRKRSEMFCCLSKVIWNICFPVFQFFSILDSFSRAMSRKTRMPGSNLHVLKKIRWTSRWPHVSDDWICIRQNVTSAFWEKSNLTFAAVFVFRPAQPSTQKCWTQSRTFWKVGELNQKEREIKSFKTSRQPFQLNWSDSLIRSDRTLLRIMRWPTVNLKLFNAIVEWTKIVVTASFQTLDKRIRHFEAKILKIKDVLDEISQDLNEVSPHLIRIKIWIFARKIDLRILFQNPDAAKFHSLTTRLSNVMDCFFPVCSVWS